MPIFCAASEPICNTIPKDVQKVKENDYYTKLGPSTGEPGQPGKGWEKEGPSSNISYRITKSKHNREWVYVATVVYKGCARSEGAQVNIVFNRQDRSIYLCIVNAREKKRETPNTLPKDPPRAISDSPSSERTIKLKPTLQKKISA